MAHVLPAKQAMLSGAELWFTPDIRTSSWTRELDWYLGFKIFHSHAFQTKPIPDPLQKILDENSDLQIKMLPASKSVLALAVDQELPAENLVIVSESDPTEWLSKCLDIWQKAQKPAVRLFLPAELSPAQVEKVWDETDNLTLVLGR